jgi:hypothetical protein
MWSAVYYLSWMDDDLPRSRHVTMFTVHNKMAATRIFLVWGEKDENILLKIKTSNNVR